MKHSIRGTVTSVNAHHSNPDMLRVEVAHGRRKRAAKGKPVPSYDDRPTSSLMIPTAHAQHYPVGKRVTIGMSPGAASDPEDDYRNTMKSIVSGKGAKGQGAC